MPKRSSSAPLIKGYLPVRLALPLTENKEISRSSDDTFFFVKEHFGADKATLFLANVPVVTGKRSRVLLKALMERFGKVERVTVIENPRKSKDASSLTASVSWSIPDPSFLGPSYSEGRFAHVVFASDKDMRRALRALTDIMSSESSQLPCLSLDKLEIQTLKEETRQSNRQDCNDDSDDDQDEYHEPKKGIVAVAERYRSSCKAMSRAALLDECNAIMERFEGAEEADLRQREAARSQPDEDGFVTVCHASQSVGSKRELDEGITGARKARSKRNRKKKILNGASELSDFYRFQRKESNKQTLQDLRKRFEQDLAKVQKMKEERQYRPF